MLQHLDVRVRFQLLHQCFLHRAPGRIGGMHNPAVRMPAFAGEMQLGGVVVVARKWHTLRDQPFHGGATVLDHESDRLVFA